MNVCKHQSSGPNLVLEQIIRNTVREQPPRICKKNNSKINCESAIGKHFIANPECAKTYTDDNFLIIGQVRSSFSFKCFGICLHQDSKPSLV